MGTVRSYRGIVALAIVLVVGFSASVLAKSHNPGPPEGKGPAQKATGGIGLEERDAWVEFNAHEAKGNRPAKGVFWWYAGGKEDPDRTIKVDVECVIVDENAAWFAGEAVMDTEGDAKVGDYLFVKVMDGGTPATDGDKIWWDWDSDTEEEDPACDRVEAKDTPNNEKPILAGNLVVHNYGEDEEE